MGSLFSAEDYPLDAGAREVEGRVGVRLVIGTSGRLIDCKVTETSGDFSLDATTCAILMQRALFRPARNARGEPTLDTATVRINWLLPEYDTPSNTRPFSAYRAAFGAGRTADGQMRCSYELNGVVRPGGRCAPISPEILAILQRQPTTSQLVIVYTFLPQGGIIAAPGTAYGQLLAEAEADLLVNENGEIGDCRTTVRRVHVAWSPPLPDPCAADQLPRFSRGAGNRPARYNISIYLGSSIST